MQTKGFGCEIELRHIAEQFKDQAAIRLNGAWIRSDVNARGIGRKALFRLDEYLGQALRLAFKRNLCRKAGLSPLDSFELSLYAL